MKVNRSNSKVRNSARPWPVAALCYLLIFLFSFELAFSLPMPANEASIEALPTDITDAGNAKLFSSHQESKDHPDLPSHATFLSEAADEVDRERDFEQGDWWTIDSDLPADTHIIPHTGAVFFNSPSQLLGPASSVSLVVLFHCWKSFLH